MEHWIRFKHNNNIQFGTLCNGKIAVFQGDMFNAPQPTNRVVPLDSVTVLIPSQAGKMIGLWNNFHERAQKQNLPPPTTPLYFLKANSCFAAVGETIRRPAGYTGTVVFEGELGVVIGKRCADVAINEADACIFGYTCINDVTARDILKSDPSFVQWTRAKSFDTFGIFGPVIARGVDPASMRVHTLVNGVEQQNYTVNDMFFSPQQLVSLISHDMTLHPGDIIACGTSVGVGPLVDGDQVDVVIDEIGRLTNMIR